MIEQFDTEENMQIQVFMIHISKSQKIKRINGDKY